MNRGLKIRAWDKEQNKYVIVQAIRFGLDGKPAQIEVKDDRGGSVHIHWVEVKNYVLEQYTGFKDENGREIYEGDIVSGNSGDIKWTIKQAKNGAWIVWLNGSETECVILANVADRVEVVGSIHENPELLEGGTDG